MNAFMKFLFKSDRSVGTKRRKKSSRKMTGFERDITVRNKKRKIKGFI